VRTAFLYAVLACGVSQAAHAQEIRLYSEFERFNPYGNPVPSDRDLVPREILSPAMARNGHLSLHLVITAPVGTNYLLYTGSNPPGILKISLYREHFTRCGTDGYCPDWLTAQASPSFGAIPELGDDLTGHARMDQTTRCYLLDIWAPPGTPPRRVRVEALLKAGTWYVAPMEVRIVEPIVPDKTADRTEIVEENVAPLDASSSATARNQLLRYLAGLPLQFPPGILRVRDVIQRNAAEDMLLARSLDPPGNAAGPQFPELNLMSWWRPFMYPRLGAEWYLKVRDFLYRFGT